MSNYETTNRGNWKKTEKEADKRNGKNPARTTNKPVCFCTNGLV